MALFGLAIGTGAHKVLPYQGIIIQNRGGSSRAAPVGAATCLPLSFETIFMLSASETSAPLDFGRSGGIAHPPKADCGPNDTSVHSAEFAAHQAPAIASLRRIQRGRVPLQPAGAARNDD